MSELSILTKKKVVTLQLEGSEDKREVILYPFAWKHFNDAIKLVNKYWNCYQKTQEEYDQKYNEIITETKEDENSTKRDLLIDTLNDQFDETGSIVKNILDSNQENLADDVQKIIEFCLRDEVDFATLNIGEVACLLTAAIEVNMDFFEQNLKNSSLFKKSNQKNPKAGELKSVA